MNEEFSIAATGDSLISMRLSVYDEKRFLSMIELIRGADLAFTNLEILLHNFEGYPAAESGGTYGRAEPYMAEELKWAGFDIVSRANNHSMDYSVGGLVATTRALDKAGLVHAGVGMNLAEAREPAYIETKKGRVALISASSTFASWGRAGKARRDMQGRPGLNPLRYDTEIIVDEDTYERLKKMKKELGIEEYLEKKEKNAFKLFGRKFIKGKKIELRTKPNKSDFEGNIRSIKDARRQADWVLFSLHAHEKKKKREIPADFIVEFSRAAIDAGADSIIGHGPHVLRGIEIYKGRPIFYSLGNFIFQNQTVKRQPADLYERYGLGNEATPADLYDARERKKTGGKLRWFTHKPEYWESVLAIFTFEGKKLHEVKLYPLDLGFGKPRYQQGRPKLADEKLSRKILKRLQKLSAPFGTTIETKNNVGYVKIE